MIPLNEFRVEATLLGRRTHVDDIRTLLNSVHVKSKALTRHEFPALLGLEPEYDAAVQFSGDEFAFLKQLRSEQLSSKKSGSECHVVATVMYNAAVHQLVNPRLNIKKRGYRSVSKRLDAIDERTEYHSGSLKPPMVLSHKSINDEDDKPDEKALLGQLCVMFRDSPVLRHRKKVYFFVYDFPACVCPTISPESPGHVMKWRERLKRTQNCRAQNATEGSKSGAIESIGPLSKDVEPSTVLPVVLAADEESTSPLNAPQNSQLALLVAPAAGEINDANGECAPISRDSCASTPADEALLQVWDA
ncbi:hypothetical protein JG688_00008079 [Phytophthora aleatoria]|uniref:Uncharacterized protein n=1 Tax=Phytophthora aleatoria TaxID=2496075 RepID=A0A8J5M4B2_9STRA|nr:hypothetical protein JG688_00008079 [Phytophthora aleatoria]